MLGFWPFQRKPPILHRTLENGNNATSNEQAPYHEESGLLSIEALATKKRVKKRDTFQRNALHIAVSLYKGLSSFTCLFQYFLTV
jgi:hypothetical protein